MLKKTSRYVDWVSSTNQPNQHTVCYSKRFLLAKVISLRIVAGGTYKKFGQTNISLSKGYVNLKCVHH